MVAALIHNTTTPEHKHGLGQAVIHPHGSRSYSHIGAQAQPESYRLFTTK